MSPRQVLCQPRHRCQPHRVCRPHQACQPRRVFQPRRVCQPHRVFQLRRVCQPHQACQPHQVFQHHRVCQPHRVCQHPHRCQPHRVCQLRQGINDVMALKIVDIFLLITFCNSGLKLWKKNKLVIERWIHLIRFAFQRVNIKFCFNIILGIDIIECFNTNFD